MKVLVCGSRSWVDRQTVYEALKALPTDTVIIHGACPKGADRIAGETAEELGLVVDEFPADWEKHGKSAGFVRNCQMIDEKPHLVIAFWDGESRGTKHTLNEAKSHRIPTHIYYC